jgi:hypothetical protein
MNSAGNMSSHMVSPRNVASLANSILSSPKRLFSSKQSNSKEAEKRKHLKIEVVTQPVMKPATRPLPRSATQLLTLLYEALTQAKNCEVSSKLTQLRFSRLSLFGSRLLVLPLLLNGPPIPGDEGCFLEALQQFARWASII